MDIIAIKISIDVFAGIPAVREGSDAAELFSPLHEHSALRGRVGAAVPEESAAAVHSQRAARGFIGRGDALARIAEVGGERADELAPIVSRVLGVKDRSFRRNLKKSPTQGGVDDTRGGGAKKKADCERSSRRAKEGSTKATAPKKPSSAVGKATGQKGRNRTEKLVRGGLRPMHGELTLDGTEHANEARGTLLPASVEVGTKKTYATAFGSWALWRRARGEPLVPNPSRPGEWESTICEFYGVVAYTMGYSHSNCHGTLYAIRRQHRLRRIYLDVRDDAMPLLSMMRKGHKRRCGAPKRKVAATIDLLLDVYENGGLDLESWNGSMAWLAIPMGFYFLLRSSQHLRKGAEVDDQKCLRMRNLIWACNDCRDDAEPGIDCDELIVYHEFSENDFMGQGTDNNITRCKDVRLCILSLISKFRVMRPSAFEEQNRDKFVFTMSDGKVLSKVVVERLLREAALRMGMDPRILASHSLRAGGCTAMFNAKYADHEIERRDRWVSSYWKIYAWSGRKRDTDVADRMASSDSNLFVHGRT